ncbi:MAG TPA: hypothetical protein V6D50_12390 [Chroococcales cyanobacterium]|jgi:hypothetical protein
MPILLFMASGRPLSLQERGFEFSAFPRKGCGAGGLGLALIFLHGVNSQMPMSDRILVGSVTGSDRFCISHYLRLPRSRILKAFRTNSGQSPLGIVASLLAE